jgi:hypothetical protein
MSGNSHITSTKNFVERGDERMDDEFCVRIPSPVSSLRGESSVG